MAARDVCARHHLSSLHAVCSQYCVWPALRLYPLFLLLLLLYLLQGMDVTGLSDCYLTFYTIPGDVLVPHGASAKTGIGSVPKTPFKHQTLSPVRPSPHSAATTRVAIMIMCAAASCAPLTPPPPPPPPHRSLAPARLAAAVVG